MGAWTHGPAVPPTLSGPGIQVWGPRPIRELSQRGAPSPTPPGDLSLVCGAPPVVVATGRCRSNQGDSHPGPSGARRCSGQLGALVPTLAFAHFRSRSWEGAKRGDKSAGFLRGPGTVEASLGDGTKSWNAPPGHSLLLGEAETTTPNMPYGGWPTLVRPVVQGANGSCSFLLFGGLNGCTGGRGRLGRLGASAERTVGPHRHVSGAPNPRASSVRHASGLKSHQPRPW